MPLSRSEMEALLQVLQPRLRSRFAELVAEARNLQSLSSIERLVAKGNVAIALEPAEERLSTFTSDIQRATLRAGDRAATLISRQGQEVIFDLTNPQAVSAMRDSATRFLTDLTRDQRDTVRRALIEGVQQGFNPRKTARLFRDSIGLTQNQLVAVVRYRSLLQSNSRAALDRVLRDRRFDSSVKRAIREGKPLKVAQIERMVERYRQRLLNHRAVTIARTESLRATHIGTEQMLFQAIGAGALDADQLERVWFIVRLPNVRDSHQTMSGQTRAVGSSFTSGAGVTLRFPGDPNAPASETINCRCVVATRFRPSSQ